MIGKKVKVFWPVDESWYTGTVIEYDASTGEHSLQYPDGDTEWVKIGEIMQANAAGGGGGGTSATENYDLMPPAPSVPSTTPPVANELDERDAWKGDMGHPGGPPYYGAGAPYPHPPPPPPPGSYPTPPGVGPYVGMQQQPPPHMSYGMYGPPGGEYGSMYPYSMALPPPAHAHHGGGSGDLTGVPGDPHSNTADGKRKTGPKPWTKEEDNLLLNLVHTMQWPMKWTVVAHSLPDRTGKQCRERYVNHLNPRLKSSDWTPLEDATIFHLYNTISSHWAKMSKIIPGRTDNGIKNRFHNIRRQYEREDTHRMRLSSVEDFPDEIRHDRLRKFPEHLTGKAADLWDMKSAIGVLAAQSVIVVGNPMNRNPRFGPFREAQDGDICVRCGLFLPSIHTGTEICSKTGWCQSCSRVPPNISGNLLRECLNLKRSLDVELREVIESWEEYFHPGPGEAWPYSKGKEETSQGKEPAESTAPIEC
jgi:Myb-like DNA-binding domain